MVWTILAVVLILNGFFNNDAWEIASAVLFGALGFRRAVMQWEKPRAVMNFGVIVFAIGLALWQMNRGDEKKLNEREAERTPTVAQEQATAPPSQPAVTEQRRDIAQPTAFAPVVFDGKPSTGGAPIGVWSNEMKNYDGCRIIFDADGDFEYQAEFKRKFGGDSWRDYSDTLEWKGQDNIWQMWAFRVKVVSGEARKLLYARDCNYVTVHDHPPLLNTGTMVKIPKRETAGMVTPPPQERTEKRTERGVTWVRLEKETTLELSSSDNEKTSSIFNKPNNCMVQITPLSGLMGTTFQLEYKNNPGAWERYDWHTMTGEHEVIWGEQELRVTTVEGEPRILFRLYCMAGGAPRYEPVVFNSADADGVVSGDAISSILKFKDVGVPCFVRLNYISYSNGDDIWTHWIGGSGKNMFAEYRGLFLPDTILDESLRIQLKSGSYKNVQYSLECVVK